jgi:hypothetical protein
MWITNFLRVAFISLIMLITPSESGCSCKCPCQTISSSTMSSGSGNINSSTSQPPPSGTIWVPSQKSTWQIILSGSIDTSVSAQVYDIDLFDASTSIISSLHSKGVRVICYFSAGSFEDWRPDANQFSKNVKSKSNGWPGEMWLDITKPELKPIMLARIQLAKQKGCDAIDPDNVDAMSNSVPKVGGGGNINKNEQVIYNTWLAQTAHSLKMSAGLKNDVDQVTDLVSVFDFTVNEQCFEYDECDTLTPFIRAGKAVFNIEYEGNQNTVCADSNQRKFNTLFKDLDVNALPYKKC